ncbi:oligopeptide/dipeptide ABC transporter ATP-binding protein [Streptosporangium sp. NPDC000095]|uniref:ABC transporter ATP-binding protein n=1 Tax=Streptosporangium sp. NPDC000095 TaxID=3366184 RepID=UPI003683C01A
MSGPESTPVTGSGWTPATAAGPASSSATGRATADGSAATSRTAPAGTPLLAVRGLNVSLGRPAVRILSEVDLTVRAGEILGIVGETGSGKTTLARTVVGLVGPDSGSVEVEGVEISSLRGRALRAHRRAGKVRFVFQDPLRSLDPDHSVGTVVGEGLAVRRVPPAERAARVRAALELVGLDPALAARTPGQISGGQRQRVSIARAIVAEPSLLICDEPVSALDASNRNHILRLLDDLRGRLGAGVVVISHDLSSLAGVADRVAVLYRGRIVEEGPIGEVFDDPRHPYTALLVASAPRVAGAARHSLERLRAAPTGVAGAGGATGGCVFAHRCPFATEACAVVPEPVVRGGRAVACHHTGTWPARAAASTPAPDPVPVAVTVPGRGSVLESPLSESLVPESPAPGSVSFRGSAGGPGPAPNLASAPVPDPASGSVPRFVAR